MMQQLFVLQEFSAAVSGFDHSTRNHLPTLVSGPSGMVLPPIMKAKQSKVPLIIRKLVLHITF